MGDRVALNRVARTHRPLPLLVPQRGGDVPASAAPDPAASPGPSRSTVRRVRGRDHDTGLGIAVTTRRAVRVPADIDERNPLMCHPSWTRALNEAQRLSDLARLRRVRDRIDREYAQPLDVEALARGVHMSAGHLSRQFRLAYGESPYSYLMTRRIERAMALLRRGDLNVTEVCFAVGCSSLGTFSTRFTELVGMSPSTYR
ncbi:AraC-type DNA-binding protein, partial [Streptosporangium subroseum]